jgi:endoglucanase
MEGGHYVLEISPKVSGKGRLSHRFTMNSRVLRSESIHLSQVGFIPGSPKRGFLSCWAGTMKGLDFSTFVNKTFTICVPGKKDVFKGKVNLRRKAGQKGDDAYGTNYQNADVYEMDFSTLTTPGEYVLSVSELGCSFPFRISNSAFAKPYQVTTRGLYYQRCGCALMRIHAGTLWARKRCHHPTDGKPVQETTLSLSECGMGMAGGNINQFAELPKRTTGKTLNYWGGWHDAGDWDRRALHLDNAAQLLDVFCLFPALLKDGDLKIPESGNGVADIVDEALWCVDFFMRGQTAAGGVRGGIESEGHPAFNTCSWKDPLHLYAYAEDAQSSYRFAWCACKAARALQLSGRTQIAKKYMLAAEKAFAWAGDNGGKELRDLRNAAAAELFALTQKDNYHQTYKETSVWSRNPKASVQEHKKHDQSSGSFSYARYVPVGKADPVLQASVRRAVIAQGNEWCDSSDKRAFRFAAHMWRPLNWGLATSPSVSPLIKAYAVTRDKKYADAVAETCAMTLGGNPLNLVWVTGLGKKRVTELLHIDSWRQSDPQDVHDVVPGLVPSGPVRFKNWSRGIHGFSQKSFFPSIEQWPPLEQYAGNRYDPGQNEHTPNSIAPAAQAYAFMYAYGLAQNNRAR